MIGIAGGRVFSNELVLRIRWPKYWSFNLSINPSNEYSGLVSYRINLSHFKWPKTLLLKGISFFGKMLFSCQVMSDSLQPHGQQHTRLPCPSHLPEFAQTHVRWVGDTIQPSYPLLSPSPAFTLSQHQGLFQRVSSSHQVAKILEFQLQHQAFQWILRVDFL